MKNKLLSLFDYFFITRPILFFPAWSTLLIGYLEASRNFQIFSFYLPSSKLMMMFFIFAASMGASFILNQLADRQTDKMNNKCFFINRELISPNYAMTYAILLIILGVVPAFIFSVFLGMVMVLFILITGWLYNFPPIALKNRPIGGLIANIIMGWLAFLPGWLLLRPFGLAMFVCSLPILFLNTALYLLTTLPDIEGDQSSGKKTIAVNLGATATAYMSLLFFGVGFLTAVMIGDYLMIAIFAGSSIYFARILINPQIVVTIRATKMTLFLYSLVVSLFFPWYAILIIAAYFGTRWYYRERFNVEYPSFKSS